MLNLLHVLPAFVDEEKGIINTIVEISAGSVNKYELITETGHLKLDRVSPSTLVYPFTYGAIPMTWDYDNDPLDVEIVNITEPLVPGSVAELRVIGVMKFTDKGEVDDKIIAVISEDDRSNHIQSYTDLGEHWLKETKYYWENYKALKKPGTTVVESFHGKEEAIKVIKECAKRYEEIYKKNLE